MRIRDGFLLRDVGGACIVVPLGERVVDFNGLITLNETGRALWERLTVGCALGELVDTLVRDFEVTPDDAARDVQAFMDDLRAKNLLVECP
jgi:hypothetical protein